MTTTKSKKLGDSKPAEKKQVEAPEKEAPKVKEVKEAPMPIEKKVESSKTKVDKEAPKPIEKKVEVLKEKSSSIIDKPKDKLIGTTIFCSLGECLVLEVRSPGGKSSDEKHDIIKLKKIKDESIHILRRRQL